MRMLLVRRTVRLFLLSGSLLGNLAGAQTLSPEVQAFVKVNAPAVALTHVRVIDGTGAAAREDQTVLVNRGKIAALGDANSVSVPKDAQIIDLKGNTVIPGLVGMHEHMFYPLRGVNFGEMGFSFPRLYLASGVTTVRTGGSIEPYSDLSLKNDIDAGKIPGPKMHVTGPYLEGEGTWAYQLHPLKGPEDATRTVNYWLDEGVDNFKAYMFITPAELSAAVAAAHKRGARVTGHLCTIGFREAAQLGIDDLEHGLLVDTEFFPWKKPDTCSDEKADEEAPFYAKLDIQSGPVHDMIADLVNHHVAVTSTLPVFEMSVPGRPTVQKRVLDALSPDARSYFLNNKVRNDDVAATKKLYGTEVSPWIGAFKKSMDFEYAFAKAGGLLLAGEDPTGMGGVLAGFGDQREVELLVEAGFSVAQAVKICSSNAAMYLGRDKEIGTIAVGKRADMVLISGDIEKNISDVRKAETVFKNGVGFDSQKIFGSVKGMVGLH